MQHGNHISGHWGGVNFPQALYPFVSAPVEIEPFVVTPPSISVNQAKKDLENIVLDNKGVNSVSTVFNRSIEVQVKDGITKNRVESLLTLGQFENWPVSVIINSQAEAQHKKLGIENKSNATGSAQNNMLFYGLGASIGAIIGHKLFPTNTLHMILSSIAGAFILHNGVGFIQTKIQLSQINKNLTPAS